MKTGAFARLCLAGLCLWAEPFTSLSANENKSGVSPNVISLPGGPGSIEGLGEAFQPALHTGTGKHSLGLKLPPGLAGHAPRLSLFYDGGQGNGALGLGWGLPAPFVQRQTDKGIPRYVDGPDGIDNDFDEEVDNPQEIDRFINESSEELVPVREGEMIRYYCRVEGAFIRYQKVGDHWEGHLPEGGRLVFGRSAAARLVDPAHPARVFRWLLEQHTDTRGNTIRYRYLTFPGETNAAQVYLAAIEYGPGAPPWGGHFHFAAFRYEAREDVFEDCRAGFPIRTGMRLKQIEVGTQGVALAEHLAGDFNGDGQPDFLNRRYELAYLPGAPVSLLGSVTLIGADGVSALPPSTYDYTRCRQDEVVSAGPGLIGATNAPSWTFDQEGVDFLDVNGDGLPDLLRASSPGVAHLAAINQGQRTLPDGQRLIAWSGPREIAEPESGPSPWTLTLSQDETVLADANGDGLTDLVQMTPFNTYYYPAVFGNGLIRWGRRHELQSLDYIPPSPFRSAGHAKTLDVDFSKRTDLIQSTPVGGGFAYQVWFNREQDTFSRRVTFSPDPGYDLSSPLTQLADLNGDRLQDVARLTASRILYTASLGHGRFLGERSMDIPDLILTPEQLAKASLCDVNGDGLADLVVTRPVPQEIWIWPNRGNRPLASRIVITGLPASMAPAAAFRWLDLNGNGTIDLVFGSSSAEAGERLQAIDLGELLGCAPRPYLLQRISNGIGRIEELSYQSSTTYALEDGTSPEGDYTYPWPQPLPFPVTVLSELRILDSLGHAYTTRYHYHDGYYDAEEKQFRGFARVEQTELGDATAPALVNRFVFDVGASSEAMKGKLLRQTAATAAGEIFHDTSTTWSERPLHAGQDGREVAYAHPLASVNLITEGGAGTPRRLESETAYDNYGNRIREANYGVVDNGDRSAFDDERIVTTEYILNTNAWILRLPKRTEVRDEAGSPLSRTDLFYDDETFSGANWGVVSIGNLTMRREWIWPATNQAFVVSARLKYDAYGNLITLLDPLAAAPAGVVDFSQGHAREIIYDPWFHTYPVSETIHIGQGHEPLSFQAAYDEGWGAILRSTDFNANPTTYGYDPFGRLSRVIKPGDTPEFPTTEYDYVLAFRLPPAAQNESAERRLINFVETRQLDRPPSGVASRRNHYFISRQFVDGLGRKHMTKTEAEPAPDSAAPRVAVAEATLFNARQQPARQLNPFFSLRGDSLDALLGFEDLEAAGWKGQFHQEGSLVALDLAAAHALRTVYDATLRPVRVTNPDGTIRRSVYEPLVVRSWDENDTDPASPDHETPLVHFRDGLGRLARVDEITRLNDEGLPAGSRRAWTTRYEYDLNDQLTRIVDSQNNVKTFTYDGLKRKTLMNDPNRGIMRFTYDHASNLIETTDAKGQRITYTYDGANRLLTEDYQDEGHVFSAGFSYDPGSPISLTNRPDVAYFYDLPVTNLDQGDTTVATARQTRGALATVWDLSGEEHTSYDSRGRVEYIVKRIPDPLIMGDAPFGKRHGLVSYKTSFHYDSADRITRLVYPDLDEISYQYNERSLLQRIPGGPSGAILSNLVYQPSAQQARIDYGNGVQTTYAYDSRLRLKRLHTFAPPKVEDSREGLSLIDFTYHFDGVSNIKSIEDRRPGAAVPEGDPRRNTQLFQYDDLYRLTYAQYSFELPGQPPRNDGEINYRYDRIGNMLAQTSTFTNHFEKGLPVAHLGEMASGGSAGRWNRVGRQPNDPPGPHALTSISNFSTPNSSRLYPYDPNGNMTEIDGLHCAWDFKDRLVAVENTEMRAAYTYDYTDRRILKRVWSKATNNSAPSHHPSFVLYPHKYFEVREHDAPTKYVWNGNTRVARVTGSLSVSNRAQRLRLWRGWNLLSLAISFPASALLSQMPDLHCYRWSSSGLTWFPVIPTSKLEAGTILWIKASTNAILVLSGTYSEPGHRLVSVDGAFLPSAGLRVWDLKLAVSNSTLASIWNYDPVSARWLSNLPMPLESFSELSSILAPGQALFARFSTSAQFQVPSPFLGVGYYHQDHLGSAAAISDGKGNVVAEMIYYPFGAIRNAGASASLEEYYMFSQKELDSESDLTYFESRYVHARLGRFTTVDKLALNPPPHWLHQNQRLNAYSYCVNRPTVCTDSWGCDPEGVWDMLKDKFLQIFRTKTVDDNLLPGTTDAKDSLVHLHQSLQDAQKGVDAEMTGNTDTAIQHFREAGKSAESAKESAVKGAIENTKAGGPLAGVQPIRKGVDSTINTLEKVQTGVDIIEKVNEFNRSLEPLPQIYSRNGHKYIDNYGTTFRINNDGSITDINSGKTIGNQPVTSTEIEPNLP